MSYKDNEIIGRKFGKLTVMQYDHTSNHRERYFLCQCDCGNMCTSKLSYLISGVKLHCGCENVKAKPKEPKIDKRLRPNSNPKMYPRIHNIWSGMKSRCYYPKNKCYHLYGARGIHICDEWLNDFNAFCSWALQNGYSDNLTIDRINNDLGYEPNNCRWITNLEQQRNKRKKSAACTAIQTTQALR